MSGVESTTNTHIDKGRCSIESALYSVERAAAVVKRRARRSWGRMSLINANNDKVKIQGIILPVISKCQV